MSDGFHIASVVVRTHPAEAESVAARIAAMDDAEIHAVAEGKIVVVLEAASERDIADRMDALRAEPGVLLVNLIFHQSEAAETP